MQNNQPNSIPDTTNESCLSNESNGHVLPLERGLSVSKEQDENRPGAVYGKHSGTTMNEDIPTKENTVAQSGWTRLLKLLQVVQRLARLQRHAINTQIDAREKRREIGFKRRDVGICDANFMKEVRSLIAQGRLNDFDKLLQLAEQCQAARDDLGPLEEEGTLEELRLEGDIWKLQETEESVLVEFENEFESGQLRSSGSSSVFSSDHISPSGEESQSLEETPEHEQDSITQLPPARSTGSSSTFAPATRDLEPTSLMDDDVPQDLMLLGLSDDEDTPRWERELYNNDSDSGIGDIDSDPESWATGDRLQPLQPPPNRRQASVEPFPHLVTDFGSRRDRINKWLEHAMLVSRRESSILFGVLHDQLNGNEQSVPSNWSQLVIAYWELDGGTTPNFPRPNITESSTRHSSYEPHGYPDSPRTIRH